MRSLLTLTLLAASLFGATTVARGQGTPPGPPPLRLPAGRTWTGQWIWTEGDPSPRNSYTYFRKTLSLDRVPKSVRVHLTADSRYRLFLNGTEAGFGPVRSDRRWLYYDTWDLTPLLKRGRNVLAVLVHHYGEWTFQYMKGRGGLIADVVDQRDRDLAHSDPSWKVLRSAAWATGQPRMSIQLGFNELFDARKEPAGWTGPTFDDSAWAAAKEIGPAGMEPWPNLVKRDIPALTSEPTSARRVLAAYEVPPAPETGGEALPRLLGTEPFSPLTAAAVEDQDGLIGHGTGLAQVRTGPGGVSFLIDFGKELTGFPRFRVRGARGGEVVDMGYGEVLQEPSGAFVPQSAEPPVRVTSGRVQARLNPDRDSVHYADRYTCRPGDQEFRTFDRRAFRYLQLVVRNAPQGLEIGGVGLDFSTYPVEERGSFQCSDERLNRIWEIGRYTCKVNMEDGYTDCPWRERGQWWGDARVEGLINYYCFGDTKLIRKCLLQKAQSMNAEGMTWGVYPTEWDGGRLPSFTLIWVATLLDYYQHTGDAGLVRQLFPRVRYTLDTFFAPRVGPRGLLKDVPYWVFIDWAPVETEGEGGALNAYYFDALRAAAAMARLIGDSSAAEYDRRAAAVKQAINTQLWDSAAGAYRDSIQKDGKRSPKISQQTNSLCVLYDIAAPQDQARILDTIYAPGSEQKIVQAGSPYFSYYQLAALFHAGRHDQAMEYIRTRWGRMLDWGATTWWEMWQPGASFCHGWSGGPTYNLGAEVLGVGPLKPGWREVRVAPHWVGLSFASGVVPTPRGAVTVAWQRDARSGAAALRLEGPEDTPIEVTLPARELTGVDRRPELPAGVTKLDAPAGKIRLRIEGRPGATLLEVRTPV
jgi:alpha-L-rhamnosidase